MQLEPIREVWIHDEAFAASRLSMILGSALRSVTKHAFDERNLTRPLRSIIKYNLRCIDDISKTRVFDLIFL
jgi:hypothetical protein